MHHRHLLPNEIDLLVDQESGFGLQPLREHVRECADCRDRLAAAQALVAALDEVPLFSPRIGLGDRVMAQVPVFVPWQVVARDAVQRWTPASPSARAVAAALVAVVGSVLSGLTLWVATRGEVLSIFAGLVGERARGAVAQGAGDLLVAFFGPQAVTALEQVGPLGIALAAAGFVLASLGTVLGLRRIAISSRARS